MSILKSKTRKRPKKAADIGWVSSLHPARRFKAFVYGKIFGNPYRDSEAFDVAQMLCSVAFELSKDAKWQEARKNHQAFVNAGGGRINHRFTDKWVKNGCEKLAIFKSNATDIEQHVQEATRAAMDFLLKSIDEPSGHQRLIDLADALKTLREPYSGPIDKYRAWLNWTFVLRGNPPTFKQIRTAFDEQFPANGIADSQLREYITSAGVRTVKVKTGPKGPRQIKKSRS